MESCKGFFRGSLAVPAWWLRIRQPLGPPEDYYTSLNLVTTLPSLADPLLEISTKRIGLEEGLGFFEKKTSDTHIIYIYVYIYRCWLYQVISLWYTWKLFFLILGFEPSKRRPELHSKPPGYQRVPGVYYLHWLQRLGAMHSGHVGEGFHTWSIVVM